MRAERPVVVHQADRLGRRIAPPRFRVLRIVDREKIREYRHQVKDDHDDAADDRKLVPAEAPPGQLELACDGEALLGRGWGDTDPRASKSEDSCEHGAPQSSW